MTKEDAIRWMKLLKKSTVNWVGEADDDIKARCEKAEQEAFDMAIEALSEPKTGEWISNRDGSWNCSECGLRVFVYAKGNFCPNCGAKMESGEE